MTPASAAVAAEFAALAGLPDSATDAQPDTPPLREVAGARGDRAHDHGAALPADMGGRPGTIDPRVGRAGNVLEQEALVWANFPLVLIFFLAWPGIHYGW